MITLGVLISGRGSNLQALIDACADDGFPARIGLVVSNRADAKGLERAQKAGLATHVLPHGDFKTKPAFEDAMTDALIEAGVDLVCLAGFMRLLSARFVGRWFDKAVNIHPSLLPAFKGLDTHRRVLAAGVRITGCTVHFVRTETDDGPIMGQAAVPVAPGDTAETLAARVLAAEHRLYPQCVRMIAEGRVRIDGRRVMVTGEPAPAPPLFAPGPDST